MSITSNNKKYYEMFGETFILASIQFAISSVEMNSKFSIKSSAKDQETLQNAVDALTDYLRIAIMWTFGLSVLFYARYDTVGIIMSVITNLLIVSWIYYSYVKSFNITAKKYNLKVPPIRIF